MTLQELQKQALQLPISDRWQLVQTLLDWHIYLSRWPDPNSSCKNQKHLQCQCRVQRVLSLQVYQWHQTTLSSRHSRSTIFHPLYQSQC